MKKHNRLTTFLRYFFLLALLSVLVFFLSRFFDARGQVSYTAPVKSVTAIKPSRMTLEKSLEFPGYVESETMVPVVPFVQGTIEEYPYKAGMKVEKDAIVAKIDSAAYDLQLKQAEAAYIGYNNAFERVETLYNAGTTTKQNYDTAKAQADAAKAQLELARLQVSYTEVKAPVSGTVLLAPQTKGGIGVSDSPLMVIADLDNLIISLEVGEKYYSAFNANRDKLRFRVKLTNQFDSEPAVADAELDSISPYIKPDSKTFTVKIRLTGDTSSSFRPGMFVKTEVIYEVAEDVLALPQRVKKSDGSIYILDEENVAHSTRLDSAFETDSAFEVDGKYSDTLFILTGQNTIIDGEKVTLKGDVIQEL
jgi:RND family efflux transporter, MFP subunit